MAAEQSNTRPGRKAKLEDAATRKRLLTALRKGHTRKAACAYARISEDALARYLKTDEEFAEEVDAAEDEAEHAIIGEIRAATRKDWRAAAWIAERRFPKKWGRREQLEHTGKDGGPIEVGVKLDDVLRGLPPDFASVVREALDGLVRQGGGGKGPGGTGGG